MKRIGLTISKVHNGYTIVQHDANSVEHKTIPGCWVALTRVGVADIIVDMLKK